MAYQIQYLARVGGEIGWIDESTPDRHSFNGVLPWAQLTAMHWPFPDRCVRIVKRSWLSGERVVWQNF